MNTLFLITLGCFAISGACRLLLLVIAWRQQRALPHVAPAKETPVKPAPAPRWDESISPDTILQFACHCQLCGTLGAIQTSRAAYVREEMQDILANYICRKYRN